jgi:galactosyl transferase GMA12/MNN10 family
MDKIFFTICFVIFTSQICFASDRVALLTMTIGDKYQNIVAPGTASKHRYCKSNKYDLIIGRESLDDSRPIPWTKILLIENYLKNYDWIFWSDADSIVMNPKIKLKHIIDNDYDLILTRDLNDLNTGQFLIKNCKWSRDFLKRVYARTEFINHIWWEQAAIIDELKNNPSDMKHVKIVPQRVMNSYCREVTNDDHSSTYQEGDFIIHFAGIRGEKLVDYMINYGNSSR